MSSVGSSGYKGRPLEELRAISKRVSNPEQLTAEDLKRFNCYQFMGSAYASNNYKILSEPHTMTDEEWIELVDGGGYNFGGRRNGNTITVYID